MSEALLEVADLGKHFGGFTALDTINLSVGAGERVGLIGPNGSGKSTLVNCLCGTLRNDSGSVRFDGRVMDNLPAHQRTRLGMARSFQLPKPFGSLSLADNIRIPLLYTVNARRGPRLSPAELDDRCGELLKLVGLAEKSAGRPRDLTQVEMRKLELARAMAERRLFREPWLFLYVSTELAEVRDGVAPRPAPGEFSLLPNIMPRVAGLAFERQPVILFFGSLDSSANVDGFHFCGRCVAAY